MLKRRLLVFLEIKEQPAGGEAAVAVRLFPRDQRRQLERLGDRHAADLSAGHLGEYEVVVLRSDPRCRLSYAKRHVRQPRRLPPSGARASSRAPEGSRFGRSYGTSGVAMS
jgi:hypothetical protein